MSNILTGMERQLIVEYLAAETPPVTFIPDNPEYLPVIFPEGTISFQHGNTASLSFAASRLLPASPVTGSIQFYYRKLGLCFSAEITANGAAGASFAIPEQIQRINGFMEETTPVKGKFFYSFHNIKPCASCASTTEFALYDPFVWNGLPDSDDFRKKLITHLRKYDFHLCRTPPAFVKKLAETNKLLYIINGKLPQRRPFACDVCLTAAELPVSLAQGRLSGLFIPLDRQAGTCAVTAAIIKNDAELDSLLRDFCCAKYLAGSRSLLDVQGRIAPLTLIYLSSFGFAVAGQRNQSLAVLSGGDAFQMQLEEESLIGSRLIQADIQVTETISGSEDKQCISCAFTAIHEEDKRFLFERFNGRLYT